DVPLPEHSSLTCIRARYGQEVFRRFFDAIVEQCREAGLVWGRELYLDATKVQANVGREASSRGLPGAGSSQVSALGDTGGWRNGRSRGALTADGPRCAASAARICSARSSPWVARSFAVVPSTARWVGEREHTAFSNQVPCEATARTPWCGDA